MKMITLPRLRLAQLQSLTESLLGICNDIPALAKPVEEVSVLFPEFKEAMLKEQASATNKKTRDKSRDGFISGLMYGIESEMCYPHTSQEANGYSGSFCATLFGFMVPVISV